MKQYKIGVLLATIFLALGISTQVEADGEEQNTGFAVVAQHNNNQIDPNTSYFYLLAKPGEEQTVNVKVNSTQKEAVTVRVEVQDGFTSDSMGISYANPNKIEKDSTLKDPVFDLVSTKTKKVTVKNFEEKVVEFKVKSPESSFEGVKFGALLFTGESPKKDSDKAMKAEASYRIGMLLASNGEQFNNGKSLKLNTVKPGLVNGQVAVIANIQNPEPYVIENLKMKTTITDKKSGDKVKEKEVTGGAVAPNSTFNFPVEWGLSRIKPGKYHFSMVGKNDFYDFKLEKDFEVSGKMADDLNSQTDFKIVTPLWVKVTAGIQAIMVVILGSVLVSRRKAYKTELKEMKKKKKKKNKREGGK